MINTRSKKKYRVKTPGGKTVMHVKQKKNKAIRCVSCGAKLNRAKVTNKEFRKLTKSQRRPQRPYPDMCPSCMRTKVKESIRK